MYIKSLITNKEGDALQENENKKIRIHCILACIYFLLLPTTIAVNSFGDSLLKLATIPIAVSLVVTIIVTKSLLKFNYVHLFLIIYTFSTAITLFVSSSSTDISYVFGYFLNAGLFICLSLLEYNERELRLLENIQVCLLVILVILTLVSNGARFGRTTLVIMGQTSDPNYFVGFFIFPLAVTMKKIIHSKYRLLYILLVGLSIYCVLLSGSRGGLLAVVVTIAAFALMYPAKMKNKLLVAAGGFVFVVLAWFILKPFLPDNIIERMSLENVLETGGTYRIDIWTSMLKEIVQNPGQLIFGRGINAMHNVFINGSWQNVVAHNQFIQVLYNQGVVGLISFALLTIVAFMRCTGKRKTVSVAIIGMMALAISLSFNQTTRTFWNLIAYAAFAFPENKHPVSEGETKLSEESSI